MKDSRQRVLDKLAKANKPSTSVKLGAVQDLQEGLGYSDVAFNVALEWNDELSNEIYEKVSLGYASLELGIEKLEPAIAEINQFMDDLGVDPLESVEDYDKAVRMLDYLQNVKSEYEKLLNSLDFRL
jgi:hypothetical protein